MTSADQLEGLDLAALDSYLRSLGIGRDGELRAEFISGGRSNLTFRVYDDATSWLVRRPPLHGLTPSAHDMAREYRVVAALQDTPVPVARTIGLCEDESVLGAPFQIVEFVAGQVVRRRAQLESFSHTVIEGCVDSLIRVLVDLHSVDPDAVGLADFGKPSGYLERQVRRWGSQWALVRLPEDRRDADVERLHSGLGQAIPQQSRTSIVHGDYRIDNTILDADDPTKVRAVVDWELSTLGDPLSDAALMCVYRDPALDLIVNAQAAWTSPLLPTADELADRYSLVAGIPLAHWEFYMALAYFKLAIIAAGIDFRRRMSDQARGLGDAAEHTPEVVRAADLARPGRIGQAARLAPAGRVLLFRHAAQLQDPRGADRHRDQPADHRGQQDRHPQRQAPMQAQEPEGRRRGVLGDEDQQQNQDHEAGDQRRPQCAGAGEPDRRFLGGCGGLARRGRFRGLLAGRVRGVAAHAAIFAPSSAE